MIVHILIFWVEFKDHGYRSKFAVTGRKRCYSGGYDLKCGLSNFTCHLQVKYVQN